ncbi:hypothetical protein B0H17DRAFT_1127697 [Mycena rosella]|uniref:Uncharacterized protein n=1 Tax=Mycena rosella TaxID=1033263 RepID=A0AAD7DYL5_MYCRO|nr:hypothetical protein B0H17DRAFT_1127697 [Mycena rosella]
MTSGSARMSWNLGQHRILPIWEDTAINGKMTLMHAVIYAALETSVIGTGRQRSAPATTGPQRSPMDLSGEHPIFQWTALDFGGSHCIHFKVNVPADLHTKYHSYSDISPDCGSKPDIVPSQWNKGHQLVQDTRSSVSADEVRRRSPEINLPIASRWCVISASGCQGPAVSTGGHQWTFHRRVYNSMHASLGGRIVLAVTVENGGPTLVLLLYPENILHPLLWLNPPSYPRTT